MSEGWIKVYRQIQDCEIWDSDEPYDYRSAWIYLLLKANHRDKDIMFNKKPVTIMRGQYLTSIRKLSEHWGWCKEKTAKYLNTLVALNMIKKDSDSRRTLLTIVNYELYQGDTDTEQDTKRTPNRTPTRHKQECKNEIININTKVFICLPLNDGTDFPVYEEDIAEYKKLYPGVDVEQQLRNMVGWLNGNPTRKKTKSGIKRFINGWLSKEQDKGGRKSEPTVKKNSFNDIGRQDYGTDLEKMLGVM